MHIAKRVTPATALLFAALWLLTVPWAFSGSQPDTAYTGSDVCRECHQDLADQFTYSIHSRLAEFERYGQVPGCEACHGAGGRHVGSNDRADIVTFGPADSEAAEARCLACHGGDVGTFWAHGEHSLAGISCLDCHTIHQSRPPLPVEADLIEKAAWPGSHRPTAPLRGSLKKPEPQLCLDCHRDVGARMLLPSRHPVREGKMNCTSCHSAHGRESGLLDSAESKSALCTTCHASKQGPFIFEHQPVAEGCDTCHVAHGSVADNLLKQNEPFLCLQCHEAHFHIGRAGLTTPNYVASGGSDNPFGVSGWRQAFGTKCTQCHQAVHGTDLPSQTTTSQGKSLTR